jgi:hypothetical protein
MYTRKSKGSKTVPCGTPDATGFVDDIIHSSVLTHLENTNIVSDE